MKQLLAYLTAVVPLGSLKMKQLLAYLTAVVPLGSLKNFSQFGPAGWASYSISMRKELFYIDKLYG